MTLKEIFEKTAWPEVAIALVTEYPNQRKSIQGYETVYDGLRKRETSPSTSQLAVELVEDNLEPGSFYYDVYGKKEGDGEILGLMFTPWSEWMGMEITKETLSALSPEEIVAHCLYEMTFCGFTEKEMEYEREKTIKTVEEAKTDPDSYIELDLDSFQVKTQMKDRLRALDRWLQWSGIAKEYFGESAEWFEEHFTGESAPDTFSEIDRHTLKAALKELATEIRNTADRL